MNILQGEFNPKQWEDEKWRFRLSSKRGQYQKFGWSFESLADHFVKLCPHEVIFQKDWEPSTNRLLMGIEHGVRMRDWCSENATGYWMDSNFPGSIGSTLMNVFNHRFAFEKADDAVLFKLTWQ